VWVYACVCVFVCVCVTDLTLEIVEGQKLPIPKPLMKVWVYVCVCVFVCVCV